MRILPLLVLALSITDCTAAQGKAVEHLVIRLGCELVAKRASSELYGSGR